MSAEINSTLEETSYINVNESQTLDSLLQNTCDTPSQCEPSENINNIEIKVDGVPELFRKRSHSESMKVYINTLKPKDTIIFIEDIKYFSHGTAFMNDFRTYYIDPILKYLNGGDPLKNDFGRDLHTSAYSLFAYSSLDSSITETCRDTVRIIQIMEALDSFKFSERNLKETKISMKAILEKSKNEFLYFDNYRNNHPKRKRFLIYIFHSDVCLDDTDELLKDLKNMKVRFTAFGVYQHEKIIKLCENFSYNNKGCKDLSGFSRSDKWPISMSNGLCKYFESGKSNQAKNKNYKCSNTRGQTEPNEYEFISFINSSVPQIPDNVMQDMINPTTDNQLNTSLNVRSMPSNETIDSNYSQPPSNLIAQNQNFMQHQNVQSKYVPTSSSPYYQNIPIQSDISKANQMPFFQQDQYYPTSSSVNNTSHRSTPSSLLPSQSSQFHTINSHSSMPQTPAHIDQIKPNSVDNSNDIISPMSNISNSMSITKSNQINQEMEMNSLHRFQNGNIPFNQNRSMNPSNFTQNSFIQRQPFYSINQPRNGPTLLFEGHLRYNEDCQTDIRIQIEQPADLNLLIMQSWEKACILCYINYVDAYQVIIYGKSSSDIDIGNSDGNGKSAYEVQIKMNQPAMENIIVNLSSKQAPTIAIIKPARNIPPEVHVQCICIMLNRNTNGFKAFIPADPRGLVNELRSRIQTTPYPVNQANPMYNQMKRSGYAQNNQQIYNMNANMQRPMINRYNSHPSGNMSMMPVPGNAPYRNMSHPSGFMNNQQMSPAPNYMLHSGPYATNPNQSSSGSYQLPMEMNMIQNQNIYDPNSYI